MYSTGVLLQITAAGAFAVRAFFGDTGVAGLVLARPLMGLGGGLQVVDSFLGVSFWVLGRDPSHKVHGNLKLQGLHGNLKLSATVLCLPSDQPGLHPSSTPRWQKAGAVQPAVLCGRLRRHGCWAIT